MKKNFFNFLLCSALFLVLTALISCGGGGGGSASLFMPENDLRNGGTGGWGGKGKKSSFGAPASNLVLTGGTALNVDHYVYNGQRYNTAQELLQVLTAQASADGTYPVEVWVSGESSARPGRYVVSGDRRTLQHPYKITINNSDVGSPFYSSDTDSSGTTQYFYASDSFPLSKLGPTTAQKPIGGQNVDFPYTYTINGQTVLATGSLSGFSGDIEYTATKEQAKYVVTADKKLAVDTDSYDPGEAIEIPANAGAFSSILNSTSDFSTTQPLDLSDATLIKTDGSSLTALDYEAYQAFNLENFGLGSIIFPAMQTGKFGGYNNPSPFPSASVVIPEGITGIGEGSFSYLDNLTSITWPTSLVTIGKQAFYVCDALTLIEIPPTVTTIGQNAFSNCSSLTSVTLHEGLETIGINAFYRSGNLASINIPKSVTTISNSAFLGCSSSLNVTVPCTISPSICSELARAGIIAPAETTLTIKADGSNGNLAWGAFQDCRLPAKLVIDSSITDIAQYAFKGCTGITEVTISSSEIGSNMFENCSSLTKVTINNPSITEIPYYAFSGCSHLEEINNINSITVIGQGAFQNCSSLNITLPNGLTTIGNDAFLGCTGLSSPFNIPASVTSIGSGAFQSISKSFNFNSDPTSAITFGTVGSPSFYYMGVTGTYNSNNYRWNNSDKIWELIP